MNGISIKPSENIDRFIADLADPDKLFNAELNGNQRRAVEFHLGDKIRKRPLKNLLRSAIAYNLAKKLTK